MKLVMLSEEYIVDLHRLQEVFYDPPTEHEAAMIRIGFGGDDSTVLYGRAATAAWHRLRDLTDEAGDVR